MPGDHTDGVTSSGGRGARARPQRRHPCRRRRRERNARCRASKQQNQGHARVPPHPSNAQGSPTFLRACLVGQRGHTRACWRDYTSVEDVVRSARRSLTLCPRRLSPSCSPTLKARQPCSGAWGRARMPRSSLSTTGSSEQAWPPSTARRSAPKATVFLACSLRRGHAQRRWSKCGGPSKPTSGRPRRPVPFFRSGHRSRATGSPQACTSGIWACTGSRTWAILSTSSRSKPRA